MATTRPSFTHGQDLVINKHLMRFNAGRLIAHRGPEIEMRQVFFANRSGAGRLLLTAQILISGSRNYQGVVSPNSRVSNTLTVITIDWLQFGR
jgi:hypothetical protein